MRERPAQSNLQQPAVKEPITPPETTRPVEISRPAEAIVPAETGQPAETGKPAESGMPAERNRPPEAGRAERVLTHPRAEMTLVEHLEELRARILVSLAALAAGTAIGWWLAPRAVEVLEQLAGDLVVVAVTEAFFSYLKIAFGIGLALAAPVILFEAWEFVVPALYPEEKWAALRYLPAALALFALGVSFGYFTVYPVTVRFLLGFASETVRPALSLSRYLGFLTGVTLPFGLVFQLPVLTSLLARLGILQPKLLRRHQRLAFFLAFVVGAVLTPPDVFSQLLMAGPIVVLYQVGIWTAQRGAAARQRALAGSRELRTA